MPAPVIVIGAGPVGLTAAVELARRGTPVRVLDKLEHPTTESRAILVHARSLEMLERIGVVEEVRATGVRTDAMEMHAAGGTVARIDLGLVDSPFPYSVTLAQTETEQILTRALAAHGVTVERGVTLTGLEQDDSGVQVALTRADGSEEHTSTPWLVGADGGHSTVRQLAGAALAGSFKGEKFLMGDVDAAHSLDPNTMYTFFSKKDGPLLAFPMRGDRIRLIAQIATTEQGPATLEWLQRVVDERADTSIQIKDARWLTLFDIHHAQVPQYRIGRVFLAGDAAHIHSPAGGQGMNTGMQDAFNLGWKLALAMEHGSAADSALLASYHQERHPVGAAVVQFTTALTKVGTLSNPIAQTLRNHLVHALTSLGPVKTAMAEKTGETVVTYRDSPLVVPAGGRGRRLGGGDHLPAAGTALRAALAGESGHVLLTVAPQGAAPFAGGGPALRQILVGGGDPSGFDHVLDDSVEETAARYGLPEGGKIMIRPDGYIAAVAPLDDDGPLLAYQELVRG